jgi:hypothetical protein
MADTQITSVVMEKTRNNRMSLQRKILISALVIAIVAIGVLGVRWHRNEMTQRASASSQVLAHQLVHVAGPGLDTVFAYGWQGKSGAIKLTGSTSFYFVCAGGTLTIGSRPGACDGDVHTLGPLGRAGDVVVLSTPNSPWAFIARPSKPSVPFSLPPGTAK